MDDAAGMKTPVMEDRMRRSFMPHPGALLTAVVLALPPTHAVAQAAGVTALSVEDDTQAAAALASETTRPLGAPGADLERLQLGRPTPANGGAPDREAVGGGGLLSTLTALGLVLGMIFGAKWLISRMGWFGVKAPAAGAGPAGGIDAAVEVLGRTAVSPKHAVVLIRVGGRVLVTAEGTGGMTALSEITDDLEVADLLGRAAAAKPDSASATFASVLSGVVRGKTAREAADPEEAPVRVAELPDADGADGAGADPADTQGEVEDLMRRLRERGQADVDAAIAARDRASSRAVEVLA